MLKIWVPILVQVFLHDNGPPCLLSHSNRFCITSRQFRGFCRWEKVQDLQHVSWRCRQWRNLTSSHIPCERVILGGYWFCVHLPLWEPESTAPLTVIVERSPHAGDEVSQRCPFDKSSLVVPVAVQYVSSCFESWCGAVVGVFRLIYRYNVK